MRRISLVSVSILFVLSLGVNLVYAQVDPNDEVTARGTFISSRPGSSLGTAGAASGTSTQTSSGKSSSSKSSSGKSTSGKSTSGKSNTSKYGTTGKSTSGKSTTGQQTSGSTTTISSGTSEGTNKIETSVAIGLGYSLYMQDKLGRSVRVDPSRTFKAGDKVRLNLESNINGYLYVFYRENDSPPIMLFPDARLNGGSNQITAHVPYEVPSSKEPDPRNQWFTFDNKPATENLYIIVTREPLPDTPIGAELAKFCTPDFKTCTVPVSETAWAKVEEGLKENVIVSKSKTYNQLQTANESKAIERGLGLTADDPEPSIVRMAAVSKSKTLVTAISLIHN
jgi:hypothetical protein